MDFGAVFTATVATMGTFLAGGAQEVGKQVVLDTYEALKKAIKSDCFVYNSEKHL